MDPANFMHTPILNDSPIATPPDSPQKKTKRPVDPVENSPNKDRKLIGNFDDSRVKKIKRIPTLSELSPVKQQKTDGSSSPTKRPLSESNTGLSPAVKGISIAHSPRPLRPNIVKSLLTEFETINPMNIDDEPFFLDLLPAFQNQFLAVTKDCKSILKKSLDQSISLDSRVPFLPKRIGQNCVSGSYAVPSSEKKMAIVVKPANQECGAAGCPSGKTGGKDGINPGESALRERMAWKVQDLLQIDLGIPPVALTSMNHPFFGNMGDVQTIFSKLENKKVSLSMEDLFQFSSNPEELTKNILLKSRIQIFEDIKKAGLPDSEEEAFASFCSQNYTLPMSALGKKLSERFPDAAWIGKVRPKMIQYCSLLMKQEGAELLIETACTLYSEKTKHPVKAFSSVQQFEENIGDLESLSKSEQDKIPVEEFHKLIIDIILLNTDRHLGNILLKKEYLSENQYIYRFVLIDHGYCLPRPQHNEECQGIKQALFEFLPFKQTNHPINGEIKKAILDLDIDSFIRNLQLDVKTQVAKYPNYADLCFVPEECFFLINFNLLVLKKGLELDLPFNKIASVFAYPDPDSRNKSGGEVIDLFQEVVTSDEAGDLTLNKALFDERLNAIFSPKQ